MSEMETSTLVQRLGLDSSRGTTWIREVIEYGADLGSRRQAGTSTWARDPEEKIEKIRSWTWLRGDTVWNLVRS